MSDQEFEFLKSSFKGVQFNDALEADFRLMWKEKTFAKNEWLLEAGRVEQYFYFVLEGVQAVYYINGKGEKVVLGFSYRGDYSGGYDSFLTRKPSRLFLEALLPSRLVAITYDDFRSLFERSPLFDRWNRQFLEAILIGRYQREMEMVDYNARERYIAFMKRCPDELRQIPQKYLASYLNMTPETFSRLRATVREE